MNHFDEGSSKNIHEVFTNQAQKSKSPGAYPWLANICVREPCEKTACAWFMNCVVSDTGQATCQCPNICPESLAPVCGHDGVTYKNHCHLRRDSCHRRRDNRLKHQGPCGYKYQTNNNFCTKMSLQLASVDAATHIQVLPTANSSKQVHPQLEGASLARAHRVKKNLKQQKGHASTECRSLLQRP
ncbi:hypothetical protein QAD02_024262 [Eretmocerus hayati]|uniref:Uncharacterized protein n=1 Tax=Eretmocerus hayati TaxID=131215 RepID=A0ACC2Q1M8_9HYME|nr:hypothetical protein QAD02_024262 [Eretmocerus hayati]